MPKIALQAALLAALTSGCVVASALAVITSWPDATDKLGTCLIERARELAESTEPASEATCSMDTKGSAVILLFPSNPVSTAQLTEVGASRREIDAVNSLQFDIGPYQRINVIPGDPEIRPQRFSLRNSQSVAILELMMCRFEPGPIHFKLEKRGGSVIVSDLECS